MKLELVDKLRTPPKRGVYPLAISDAGVLCAVEGDDEGAAALELTDESDRYEVLPELSTDVHFVLYAVCNPGGGKSTYLGRLAHRFKEVFGEDATVVCFSTDDEEDPNMPDVDVRINVRDCDELSIDDVAGEEGTRTLCIWDDHLCGLDKHQLDAVLRLQRQLIQVGRKKGISVAVSAHKAATGKESQHILNSMTHLVCWPHHGASKNMRRVIGTYAQQPEELLTLLRRDPMWGRAVCIRCSQPACAIGERRAMLLDRPEVIEGVARGLIQKIVKDARDGRAGGSNKPGEASSAAEAIAAARNR